MKSCPSCSSALVDQCVDRFIAEVCSGCGGIWFPAGQFAKMMHDADMPSLASIDKGPAPEHPAEKTPTLCADCGQSLEAFNYTETSVVLYRCVACGGMFLPFNEVQALKNRQLSLFGGYLKNTGGVNLSPEVREAAATLDAIAIGDQMRSQNFVAFMNRISWPLTPFI